MCHYQVKPGLREHKLRDIAMVDQVASSDEQWGVCTAWMPGEKGMIHLPCRTERDGGRIHQDPQNGMQCKMYESFISGNVHLTFFGHGWPQGTEAVGSKTGDEGGTTVLLHFFWHMWHKCRWSSWRTELAEQHPAPSGAVAHSMFWS